jgi:hypothetical protein
MCTSTTMTLWHEIVAEMVNNFFGGAEMTILKKVI